MFRTVKVAVDEMLFQKECLSITFVKDGQYANDGCDIEACSCNHCCSGKAV